MGDVSVIPPFTVALGTIWHLKDGTEDDFRKQLKALLWAVLNTQFDINQKAFHHPDPIEVTPEILWDKEAQTIQINLTMKERQ